jgi:hypothetical protein
MERENNMPNFTDRELFIAQIIGGSTFVITLVTGMIGNLCLKAEKGLPEYMTSLEKTSWALLIIAIVWTGLATWRRLAK